MSITVHRSRAERHKKSPDPRPTRCRATTFGYGGWSLMLLLLYLTGPKHPPTADDTVPLDRGRMVLGWLTLSFAVLGFTPQPFYGI